MPRRLCRLADPPLRNLLVAVSLLAFMAACQATGSSRAPVQTASVRSAPTLNASDLTHDQALRAVQSWGGAYSRNERDKAAALNYAAALRAAGQSSQAVAVLRKAAIYHPRDREVLAEYGKALAADGQFDEALVTIHKGRSTATVPTGSSWRRKAAFSIRSASTTTHAASISRHW
jgi:Flp pilus assembly protein TadD